MIQKLSLCAGTLALSLLLPAAARADGPAYRELPIPLPEKAVVSVEIDAHQDDLVGVVKSMLKGLNIPALMTMVGGMSATAGITLPEVAPDGSPIDPAAPAKLQPAAPNFADLLKNINQLHMVVFKAEGLTPDQAVKFYEQPFMEQGGRRVMWVNQGERRMLMMGFKEPRGFALVVPTATDVTVIRADGYPDLEGVGSFVTMMATMVGSLRSTMSDIFDSSGGGIGTPTEHGHAMPDWDAPARPAPAKRGVKRRPASLAPVAKTDAKKTPAAKGPVKRK